MGLPSSKSASAEGCRVTPILAWVRFWTDGAWAVVMCLCKLPAACDAMDGTKGGLLMDGIPAGWSRMTGAAISPIS